MNKQQKKNLKQIKRFAIEELENKIDLARHKGDLVTGNKLFEEVERLRKK